MKRLVISIFVAVSSIATFAQNDSIISAAKAINNMPDSLLPYLKSEKKQQLVEMAMHHSHADIGNELDGSTALDSLSADYAVLTPNSVSHWQIAILNAVDGRRVLMLVQHHNIPVTTSDVFFYDEHWNILPSSDFITVPAPASLVSKPTQMDADEFALTCSLIQPPFIEARYDHSSQSICFSLSSPLLQKNDLEKVKTILVQKYVKWNGRKFE